MCKPKKIFVLDRFEGETAVMVGDEGGEQINAPGLRGREGDVFEFSNGRFTALEGGRAARESRVRAKMDALFGDRRQK